MFVVKYIRRENRKRQHTKVKVNCRFLRLRKANGQKRGKEQNREDGEKSGLMQISQG